MIKLHLQDAGSHKICTKIIVCTLDFYCALFKTTLKSYFKKKCVDLKTIDHYTVFVAQYYD